MNLNDVKIEKTLNSDISSPFQTLASPPISLRRAQCVVYNYEILICGSYDSKECYSYHTIKNQYKYICSYPKNVVSFGHCVVSLGDSNQNEITLLSFGGQPRNQRKHTLVMKYISVWDNEITDSNPLNKWVALRNNDGKEIIIGRYEDDYQGVKAIIGGSNDHLLFVTYHPKNIDVFDLNTLKYINFYILPTDGYIKHQCFLSADKHCNHMLLFSKSKGLSIEYDEQRNIFQFHEMRVCAAMRSLCSFGHVYINGCILFFGGEDGFNYSMKDNKWTISVQNWPTALRGCITVLNDDNTFMHILGQSDENYRISIHLKTKIDEWMEIEQRWIEENKEILEAEDIRAELEQMKRELDINKLN
ncbi:hypothetical protein RFI_06200, partial [Reticulomyxa filosa]